jgi:glycosyltransferase involved in cell wall biosynthesis
MTTSSIRSLVASVARGTAALRETLRAQPSLASARSNSHEAVGVCMVIERYYPYIAGAEKQLQARTQPLARRGVKVVVVTRREGGLAARETVADAPVFRMPTRGSRVVASLQFTLASLLFLARHRGEIDVLHAYNLFSPATIGLLAKLVLRIPVTVELHSGGRLGEIAVLRSVNSGAPRLRLLARFVDVFVALSDEIERGLRGIGVPSERIVRIPNGVDPEYFRPADASRRQALRTELDLEGRRVALFVGRLEPEKGLECLLEAWREVRRELPGALLLLVGDGVLRASLHARAVPGVRLVGPVSDPLPHLQAADCFVLPSESEGLPVALLEALATGLPCVATAIGGTVDVLSPDVDGWLVRPGDAATLAATLVRALNGEGRARIGAAGRARVIHDFSLESAADRLAELYRRLARLRAGA